MFKDSGGFWNVDTLRNLRINKQHERDERATQQATCVFTTLGVSKSSISWNLISISHPLVASWRDKRPVITLATTLSTPFPLPTGYRRWYRRRDAVLSFRCLPDIVVDILDGTPSSYTNRFCTDLTKRYCKNILSCKFFFYVSVECILYFKVIKNIGNYLITFGGCNWV